MVRVATGSCGSQVCLLSACVGLMQRLVTAGRLTRQLRSPLRGPSTPNTARNTPVKFLCRWKTHDGYGAAFAARGFSFLSGLWHERARGAWSQAWPEQPGVLFGQGFCAHKLVGDGMAQFHCQDLSRVVLVS